MYVWMDRWLEGRASVRWCGRRLSGITEKTPSEGPTFNKKASAFYVVVTWIQKEIMISFCHHK